MADKNLPRIALATEETAVYADLAAEALTGIKAEIKGMNFSLNMKLGSIAMMLGDFFEVTAAAQLRAAMLAEKNKPADAASTSPMNKPDEKDSKDGIEWTKVLMAGFAAFAISGDKIAEVLQGSLFFEKVGKALNSALGISAKAAGLGAKITTGPIGKFIGTIGSLFSRIGSLLKLPGFGLLKSAFKMFPFVRAISGLFSFVSGFVDGYDEEGLFGGFKEGFATLAESFIGWPINLLKDGLAYVLEKFGILTEEQKTSFNDFDFIKIIGDGVRIAFDWFKLLFTDPVAALSSAWTATVAGFTSIGQWLFDTAVKPAYDWLAGIFAWAGEVATEGWTNVTDFVKGVWTNVKTWFSDKINFAKDTAVEGWTGLKDFVVGKFTDIKEWFTEKFTFAKDAAIEGWTGLKDFVVTKFTDIKTWFTDKLSFASEAATEGVNFVSDLVKDAWESVKTWFLEKLGNVADALPSIDDIKTALISNLPGWMVPDRFKTPEMIAESAMSEIAREQSDIARSQAGDNVYGASFNNKFGREDVGQENSARRIAELQAELRETLAGRGMTEQQITQIINNNNTSNNNTSTTTQVALGDTGGDATASGQ